jgi:hypothetical protein
MPNSWECRHLVRKSSTEEARVYQDLPSIPSRIGIVEKALIECLPPGKDSGKTPESGNEAKSHRINGCGHAFLYLCLAEVSEIIFVGVVL